MKAELHQAIAYCERTFGEDECVKKAWENKGDDLLFWFLLADHLETKHGYHFPKEEALEEFKARGKRADRELDEEVQHAAHVVVGKGVRRVYVVRVTDGVTHKANVRNALPAARPACHFPWTESPSLKFVRYNDTKIKFKVVGSVEAEPASAPCRGALPQARAGLAETGEKETPEHVGIATGAMGDCIGLALFAGLNRGVYEMVALAHLPGGNHHAGEEALSWKELLKSVGHHAAKVAKGFPQSIQALIFVTRDRLKDSSTTPDIIHELLACGFVPPQILVYVSPDLPGFAVDRKGRFGVLPSEQVLALEGF